MTIGKSRGKGSSTIRKTGTFVTGVGRNGRLWGKGNGDIRNWSGGEMVDFGVNRKKVMVEETSKEWAVLINVKGIVKPK